MNHLTQFRERNRNDNSWGDKAAIAGIAGTGAYLAGRMTAGRIAASSARKTNAAVAGRVAKTVAAAPSPAAAAQVVRATKDPMIRRAQGKLSVAEEASKRRMGKTKRGLAITSGPAGANPKTGPMAAYYAGRDFQGEQPTVDLSRVQPGVVSAVLNNLRSSGVTTNFAYPNEEDHTLRNAAVAGAGVAGGIYARGRFGKGYKPGQGFGETMKAGVSGFRGDVSRSLTGAGAAAGAVAPKGGFRRGLANTLVRAGRFVRPA